MFCVISVRWDYSQNENSRELTHSSTFFDPSSSPSEATPPDGSIPFVTASKSSHVLLNMRAIRCLLAEAPLKGIRVDRNTRHKGTYPGILQNEQECTSCAFQVRDSVSGVSPLSCPYSSVSIDAIISSSVFPLISRYPSSRIRRG